MKNKVKLAQIERLRKQIDACDRSLFRELARRFKAVEQIGSIKAKLNLPVFQKNRSEEVRARHKKLGRSLKLEDKFVQRFFTLLQNESIRAQKALQKRG